MRKIVFTGLVLLSLLVMTTGAALAAGSALTLIEVRNDPRGNVIFVFSVDGNFSRGELNNGSVQAGDDSYGLHCNQVDDNTVQCTTSKKTGGQNVVIHFGGANFWAFVPEARVPAPYCYGTWTHVYVNANDELTFNVNNALVYFGEVCQEDAAVSGDTILHNVSQSNNEFDIELFFVEEDFSQNCKKPADFHGPAYYLAFCVN